MKPRYDTLTLFYTFNIMLREIIEQRGYNENIININNMTIDKRQHRVSVNKKEVVLTAREFDILYLLATNRGRVFSAEEIFERVWKEKYYQSNNTVMVHMSRLRDKLEQNSYEDKIIHTVWGVGYKIEK